MNKLTLNEPAKKGTKTVLSCADGVNRYTDDNKDNDSDDDSDDPVHVQLKLFPLMKPMYRLLLLTNVIIVVVSLHRDNQPHYNKISRNEECHFGDSYTNNLRTTQDEVFPYYTTTPLPKNSEFSDFGIGFFFHMVCNSSCV